MKKNTIVKILWFSLGIHVVYFLLFALFAVCQKQIQAVYMPVDFKPHIFSFLFLTSGDMVYLAVHVVLTIILVKQLSGGESSVSGEVVAAIVFGGALSWADMAGNYIASIFIGNYIGSIGLASYSVFKQGAAIITPIRLISYTLLLAAVGMSFCYKSLGRDVPREENQNGIVKLFWISLVLDILYFIIMMVAVMFQDQYKSYFHVGEVQFVVPVIPIASSVVMLLLHILFTAILVRQLKSGRKGIAGEILGIIFYGGSLTWLGVILAPINLNYMALHGMTTLMNLVAVNMIFNITAPIREIGAGLFVICCGMAIFVKTIRPEKNDVPWTGKWELRQK